MEGNKSLVSVESVVQPHVLTAVAICLNNRRHQRRGTEQGRLPNGSADRQIGMPAAEWDALSLHLIGPICRTI